MTPDQLSHIIFNNIYNFVVPWWHFWIPGFPIACSLQGQPNVRLKTGVVSNTAVFFVISVAESWCHCAITQRRAACWLESYAVPIWLPWTPTATLTPSSKCKSDIHEQNWNPTNYAHMQLFGISRIYWNVLQCLKTNQLWHLVMHGTLASWGKVLC